MAEGDTDSQQELGPIGMAELVVGIPSYNNAETIGSVIQAAQTGLTKYCSSLKGVIIHADGGSTDGTPRLALELAREESPLVQVGYPIYPVHKLTPPYYGIPGKGNAFQTIFSLAQRLGARACIILDAEHQNTAPEWIEGLVRPVLERGYDFVAPYYRRHKYDGLLTTSVVYPIIRALYGKRIRHPIGSHFGLSVGLLDHYLDQDVWDSDVARFGIEMWLTMQAMRGGFKLCQAVLGTRIHVPKDPGADLGAMLAQVLGALFIDVERHVEIWQKMRGSVPVPLFGGQGDVSTELVPVNIARMIESFRLGCQTLLEIWSLILPPATLLDLKRLARRSDGEFQLSDELWARVTYDFALAHRLRLLRRDHLLGALVPLYLGWVASLISQIEDAGPEAVEDRIERLCLAYETNKPYLISRWRWPDRFNP